MRPRDANEHARRTRSLVAPRTTNFRRWRRSLCTASRCTVQDQTNNGTNGVWHIYGLVINTDSNTKHTDGVMLASLNAGDAVEVDGPFNANDQNYTATHIEKSTSFQKVDLINAQTVFDAAPPSALLNGQKAVATGPGTNGVMTAKAVTIGPSLVSVQSRKTLGSAGIFNLPVDTNVSISGAVTVEPRAMGSSHTIVFHFDGPVTSVGGVTAKDAALAAVGSATFVFTGNDVVISPSGVPDSRRAKITLTDVNLVGKNATAAMGFLVGDVNNTRAVDGGDLSGVKARSGHLADATNFMFDVTASGLINGADIMAVKARSGHALNKLAASASTNSGTIATEPASVRPA